jgi:hypothetical protein
LKTPSCGLQDPWDTSLMHSEDAFRKNHKHSVTLEADSAAVTCGIDTNNPAPAYPSNNDRPA